MTFPLGSANLLRLHGELWRSRRALLTNTASTGSRRPRQDQPSAEARQFIRRLLSQNTYRSGRIDANGVSLLLVPFLLSFSVIPTHKHKKRRKIHRSDKVRQQRCRKKDRNWPKGVSLSALPHQFQCFIKGTRGP